MKGWEDITTSAPPYERGLAFAQTAIGSEGLPWRWKGRELITSSGRIEAKSEGGQWKRWGESEFAAFERECVRLEKIAGERLKDGA